MPRRRKAGCQAQIVGSPRCRGIAGCAIHPGRCVSMRNDRTLQCSDCIMWSSLNSWVRGHAHLRFRPSARPLGNGNVNARGDWFGRTRPWCMREGKERTGETARRLGTRASHGRGASWLVAADSLGMSCIVPKNRGGVLVIPIVGQRVGACRRRERAPACRTSQGMLAWLRCRGGMWSGRLTVVLGRRADF
jgi:hypothetical protein